MNTEPISTTPMSAGKCQVLGDIAEIIRAVSDHIPVTEDIRMETMLVADLALESIELASLFVRVRARYGDTVSIADFVLEVVGGGSLSDLRVGRIVEFIADSLQPGGTAQARQAEPGQGQAAKP
jgi:hypothetical protein